MHRFRAVVGFVPGRTSGFAPGSVRITPSAAMAGDRRKLADGDRLELQTVLQSGDADGGEQRLPGCTS